MQRRGALLRCCLEPWRGHASACAPHCVSVQRTAISPGSHSPTPQVGRAINRDEIACAARDIERVITLRIYDTTQVSAEDSLK